MSLQERVERIRERFGDKVLEIKTPYNNRLYVKVDRSVVVEAARFLKEDLGFDMPISAGGTDYIKKKVIELFWIIWSTNDNMVLILKTDVDRDNPEIDSLTSVWLGVQKFERETWELLGVNFRGHPKLKPLLLPEDWDEGYPLRKDFNLESYKTRWGDM
jgi:NADH:ubiquinone oxidoreductase subunit C